ncbi:MAG TPA: GNAT family N-acetyltransferase [Acidimicrobiales bacterium]|nr:GNAT family N-acetyltransferase [Acidimicrobiales bacterium]
MRIGFRPLRAGDMGLLARWQSSPHVARWWPDPADLESITARYSPRVLAEERTDVFVIELDGSPVGMIQRYRHRDHQDWDRAIGIPDAAGIDYYIGEADQVGRGVGPAAIAAFARDTLARYEDVRCIVAAPQQDNRASWRALEKAGFTRVWSGMLDSDDPSDAGPAFVYRLDRRPPDE